MFSWWTYLAFVHQYPFLCGITPDPMLNGSAGLSITAHCPFLQIPAPTSLLLTPNTATNTGLSLAKESPIPLATVSGSVTVTVSFVS